MPLPFGRGVFVWGNPIWVPAESSDGDLGGKREELESALNRITSEADARWSSR